MFKRDVDSKLYDHFVGCSLWCCWTVLHYTEVFLSFSLPSLIYCFCYFVHPIYVSIMQLYMTLLCWENIPFSISEFQFLGEDEYYSYRCDSEVCFLLSNVALSSRHSSIIPELCCQAMVRPAPDMLCTTGMLWIGEKEKWEEGGVWTYPLPPTASTEIFQLTWSLTGPTAFIAET